MLIIIKLIYRFNIILIKFPTDKTSACSKMSIIYSSLIFLFFGMFSFYVFLVCVHTAWQWHSFWGTDITYNNISWSFSTLLSPSPFYLPPPELFLHHQRSAFLFSNISHLFYLLVHSYFKFFYKRTHVILFSVSNLFHLALWPQLPSISLQMAWFHSLLQHNNIPLCIYTIFSLSTDVFMGI